MPSAVYTLELWALLNAPGPGTVFGPTPPAGFVWVVRDVTFFFPISSGFFPVKQQANFTVAGLPVASTPLGRSFANQLYAIRELRQTVNSGDLFAFTSGISGWNMRVTGYQLSVT